MSLKITISDIAKELNTTPATVSRALRNHKSISEKTKKNVHEAAIRLNYKRNNIASSLRKGSSKIIGVIIPSAEINFFGSVVHGIESIANNSGYSILIYQSNENYESEKQGIDTFLSARVDGILVSIAKNTTDFSHFLAVKKSNVPIVFFDRSNDEIGIHSVVIDDFKGAFLATQHLIEQGYKRIAHISGPRHLKVFNNRLKGYEAALKASSFEVDSSLIYSGNVSIEAGKEGINYFLSMEYPPDAVFAVEDFTALGAIKALKEKNINVPQEFGIVGFANETFGEHITPTLSTIDQQTVQMGKLAFIQLENIINNLPEILIEQRLVLEPVAIFRESSQRNTQYPF